MVKPIALSTSKVPAAKVSYPKTPKFISKSIEPKAKGGEISPKTAVHKHEKNMHKGEPLTKLAKGGFIKGAIKHPGALRAQLGAKPGKPIPAAKLAKAAKAGGKLGQRARFAETLKGLRKKK